MMVRKRLVQLTVGALVSLNIGGGAAYLTTYHPAPIEPVKVYCSADAPVLRGGQKIKVLDWNVQYMAGKNHVFFYDLLDGSGPDERSTKEEITATFDETARVIKEENPDVIILEEVDDGAKRSDYEDQLARLLALLPADYKCNASALYWKADFVPHPRIMGAVGMKLSIISKYKIDDAIRYQLPVATNNVINRQFNFRRAVLEADLPVDNGRKFSVLSTHLDAFAQGSDTMAQQADKTKNILSDLDEAGYDWIIGGDFNLLPPGKQYGDLPKDQQAYYNETTEIEPLFAQYKSVPSLEELNGSEGAKWYTYFSNEPSVKQPDRTIDYIFASQGVSFGEHYVRSSDTLKISDHLPVVTEVNIP
jgi:endonuclease/exonuclease/phosphatase family metal-dependent hydrolase